MAETRKAKLIHHDGILTVVLPEDFGLEGDEVYVTRDEASGDVTLSPRPTRNVWQDMFDEMDGYEVSDEDWEIFDAALREAREDSVPPDDRRIRELFLGDE